MLVLQKTSQKQQFQWNSSILHMYRKKENMDEIFKCTQSSYKLYNVICSLVTRGFFCTQALHFHVLTQPRAQVPYCKCCCVWKPVRFSVLSSSVTALSFFTRQRCCFGQNEAERNHKTGSNCTAFLCRFSVSTDFLAGLAAIQQNQHTTEVLWHPSCLKHFCVCEVQMK